MVNTQFNQSGSKYLREMRHMVDGRADVHAVLIAFNVSCPARQHAIKKLLCSGIRGKGDCLQDLREARDAIDRAIQIAECDSAPETKVTTVNYQQPVSRDIQICCSGKAGPFDRGDLVEVLSIQNNQMHVCHYQKNQPETVNAFTVPINRFRTASPHEIEHAI